MIFVGRWVFVKSKRKTERIFVAGIQFYTSLMLNMVIVPENKNNYAMWWLDSKYTTTYSVVKSYQVVLRFLSIALVPGLKFLLTIFELLGNHFGDFRQQYEGQVSLES